MMGARFRGAFNARRRWNDSIGRANRACAFLEHGTVICHNDCNDTIHVMMAVHERTVQAPNSSRGEDHRSEFNFDRRLLELFFF